MNFLEIQSWPQIPSIAFSISLFSSSFKLPDIDIEDLEEALLLDSSENNLIDDTTELTPRLVPELIVSLLRGCDLVKSCNITTSNYQMFLRRLFRHKCEEYDIENPFNTDTDFHSLSLLTKVVILNYLCDFRLDSTDVEAITNGFEADSLRLEPLGEDSSGSIYWYFYGTRLYREDFKKKERIWQVICFTEQDWENLANKFKHSKSRKETALYKTITEDFLPNIPILFKAKEAERRRRLFQRRSSQRVKVIRDQQKRISGENSPAVSDEDSDSKLSYSEKYLVKKKQQFIAQSKLREKIQEDRAQRAQRRSSSSSDESPCTQKFFNTGFESFHENQNNSLSNKENILHSNLVVNQKSLSKMPPTSTKLPGRQTNNSLSSITGQIVIQTPSATSSPGPSTSRKKKAKPEVFMETDEVLQIGMHKVLQQVKNQDDAWPFMDPVEEDIAPRYYSIIKRPMDLLKMEEKLDNGEYRSFTEFRTDFKLIVNNCRLYNGQSNEYTEMVNNLQQAFDRATKKFFDATSSDEEPVLLEYPPIEATNAKLNASKEIKDKDGKKEKFKAKERKHIKQSAMEDNSTDDEAEKSETKVMHKKSKDLKNKPSVEPIKKEDKNKSSSDKRKEKEKSIKGVKRKHKDKDKSDRPKAKKMKEDFSDAENGDFAFESDRSVDHESENEISIELKKKVKNGKKVDRTLEKSKAKDAKSEKKSKKNEMLMKTSGKRKVKSPIAELKSDSKKKSRKESPQKSEKFSKTNEKANNKKKIVEKSFDDDSDSDGIVHDLIDEKKSGFDNNKTEPRMKKMKEEEEKHSEKKSRAVKSTPKKSVKKSGSKKKSSFDDDDKMSISSRSFSRSPSPLPSINSSALTEDLTNSFDYDQDKSSKSKLDSSFRSDTPEIKDKFDLIKERRNRLNQEKEKVKKKDHQSHQKEKNQKLKETIEKLKIKNEKSKSHIEFIDEVLGGKTVKKESSNVFDKLKNESSPPKVKSSVKKGDSSSHKELQEKVKTKKSKLEKKEEKPKESKVKSEEKLPALANPTANNKNKKQNKASLDVLDMETEQTLKDINKWLEHTPRFEYSSASNSPSRYIMDEIEMPSKMDDNDFRKPIPLMPSSPSASHANFQSPPNTPKDFNLLKESNNNKQASASQNPTVAGTSSKKVGSKEPKRKSLKEKLQQLPKKKEVQRTIDRLQPGKTKGNLLHNIQNINKPEEFFPLGNRDKIKEVKNSLIVQTDESSPKLSLGTVLDTQSFNFNDSETKKQDNDCFDEPSMKIEDEKDEKIDDDSISQSDDTEAKTKNENSKSSSEDLKGAQNKSNAADAAASKPNLNAWFKAFGAPKKPKKSESQDDSGKMSDNVDAMKIESSYLPTHHRRLSTGSSVSERSSVEDSPQVGLEERLGAPAPYPSPIGASPIMASPKTDDCQKSAAANYPVNGSIGRVGFYQDTTSTKSSPEKSCSPREMPSPYGQYSQQHLYSGGGSGTASAGMYGSFYNPENTAAGKTGQASYSKPTTSPASYYDQYKQPMSQESEFNNSMSPSTNPNSPYHSQQSSPYQQQPNSPFQSPAGGNSGANLPAPNSPYSQPSSPYQQPQPSSFHQSTSSSSSNSSQSQKGPTQTNQQNQTTSFNNQSAFPQIGTNSSFNQSAEQFPSSSGQQQSCAKPSDWNSKVNTSDSNAAYNIAQHQQVANNFNLAQHQNPANLPQHHHSQQHILNSDASTFQQGQAYNKKSQNEPQSSGTPATTPLYGTGKLADLSNSNYSGVDMVTKNTKQESVQSVNKQHDSSKYLDLSKQQAAHMNPQQTAQYQQMFDLANYSKPPLDFDITKNKSVDMFNRSLPKNNLAMSSANANQGFWGNANASKVPDSANYGINQTESSKLEIPGKSAINSILNNSSGNSFLNNSLSHQQSARNQQVPPPAMDINYKQPLFNNPAASSMMDLTAFMRDFRQAEERYSTLSGATSSFYDKTITPAHMFGKNLQQANTSAALQQMFNSSISTMAYNREQQNMNLAGYHNRLNAPQISANSNQANLSAAPQVAETKAKKSRKKKNASPDEAAVNSQAINPQHQQHHQTQSHQHTQQQQQLQHQQLAHQQSFQSYGGLKIQSAAGATDPSAISLKSVVPGSAFNYGPTPLAGLYDNPAYLDEFRGTPNPYYPPPGLSHRSTPDPAIDKTSTNPPPAHPQAPSSPYHHLLPPHHPSRSSYSFMNSLDPATLQQQYRMMLNQTYQAGYHPALGMHNQPPHWGHHM